MCGSCVCAHDVNSDVNGTLPLNSNLTHITDVDICNMGSAKELDMDISGLSSGDTYDFEKDFYLNDTPSISRYYEGIHIEEDNVTLNGNGHVIWGNHQCIFKVTGNNVKIFNLTICNTNTTRYACDMNPNYYKVSPINWNGNNGVISHCCFYNNSAVNGGALRLSGNNSIIDNCVFVGNSVKFAGGAIYVLGVNNTLSNSYFENCTSLVLKNQMIYLNPRSKLDTVNNTVITEDINSFIMRADYTCVDADWLYNSVYDDVLGSKINLYEIVFSSMSADTYIYNGTFSNEVINWDESLKYNVEYDGVDFFINFNKLVKNFDSKFSPSKDSNSSFLVIVKTYHLKNIRSMGDAFIAVHDKKYLIKNMLAAEYNLQKLDDIDRISYDAIKNYLKDKNTTTFLNIMLQNKIYSINGNGLNFNHLSKYTTIFVKGNGAEIVGPHDEKKEYSGFKLGKKELDVVLENLTVKGFNHGIFIDKGTCTLLNVKIVDNKCKYKDDTYKKNKDWGAGILNLGTCIVGNCTFINNYARKGGAIFNDGLLIIDNMSYFANNTGFKVGNDILYVDSAVTIFNGTQYKGDSAHLNFTNGTIKLVYKKGLSADLGKAIAVTYSISFGLNFLIAQLCGDVGSAIILGSIVGAGVGFISSFYFMSHNYDFHFTFWKIVLIMVPGSIAVGIAGGVLGSLTHDFFKSKCAPNDAVSEVELSLDGEVPLDDVLPLNRIVA